MGPAASKAHDHNSRMHSAFGGPFQLMEAIGSGTSLSPSSSPGYMWHWMSGSWSWMFHGELKAGFNHQGGPRGIGKAESQNWAMLMTTRRWGPGHLMARGMFTAEPWTAPPQGFPQLFQTGETYRQAPIIDAQHPHELFMEIAAGYTLPVSERISLHFYGGPVAEPALGPVAFMHRPSALENPAAPLGHHLQDSTHIAHGVITSGATVWRLKVEGSVFRGAEPDENRKDIELGKLDSWSARVWFAPTPDWTIQFSHGHLIEPDAQKLGDVNRKTASISHNRSWTDGFVATTLIWGRNKTAQHGTANSYLLESTGSIADKNYVYTRLEHVDKSLFFLPNVFGRPGIFNFAKPALRGPIPDVRPRYHFLPAFGAGRVSAFTFGAVRDIYADSRLRVGIGADVTTYRVPPAAKPGYGSNPASFRVFLRVRPAKMN